MYYILKMALKVKYFYKKESQYTKAPFQNIIMYINSLEKH